MKGAQRGPNIVVCDDANDGSGRFAITKLAEMPVPPTLRVVTLATVRMNAVGGATASDVVEMRFAHHDGPLTAARVDEQVRDWEVVARARGAPIGEAVTKKLHEALRADAVVAQHEECSIFVLTTTDENSGTACMIGVAMTDWLAFAPKTTVLACLVVSPVMQRHGMGRRLYALVESLIRRYGALNIHLVSEPDVAPFWAKQGFAAPGPSGGERSHEALFPEATLRPPTGSPIAAIAGVAYASIPGLMVKDLRKTDQRGVRFENPVQDK